jgi:hypothetical protein
MAIQSAAHISLGLKENWRQFTLLVIINAFVGGMVGLERTILPELAAEKFGVASKTAILSFITAFGISKAAANFFMGKLANRFGRPFLSYSFMRRIGIKLSWQTYCWGSVRD